MASKIFSVLTTGTVLPTVAIETECIVVTALKAGWYMRSNALLGANHIGHTYDCTTKLLYVPVGHVVSQVDATVPEPSPMIVEWADKMLVAAKLKPTPVNRSIVYAIYGYNSDYKSKFIISTSKKLTNQVLRKLVDIKEIPIITTEIRFHQIHLKKVLKP